MYAMKQFTLPLDNETQRPITFLQNWHGLDAMIDTGSLFPVWVDDEKFLSKLGAEVVIDHVEFGGFGGSAEGRLYVIPTFQFAAVKAGERGTEVGEPDAKAEVTESL